MILQGWNAIFTYFLNGIGKIRLQLYSSIIESVLFFPLAWVLAIYCNMKISGFVLASMMPYVVGAFWTFLQYKKIVNPNDPCGNYFRKIIYKQDCDPNGYKIIRFQDKNKRMCYYVVEVQL